MLLTPLLASLLLVLAIQCVPDRRKRCCDANQPHSVLANNMTTQNSSDSQSGSNNLPAGFQDRRDPNRQRKSTGLERRQFSDGHNHLSPEAAEVGRAVDQYKLENHRRFVTYEELLAVIKSLGYEKRDD